MQTSWPVLVHCSAMNIDIPPTAAVVAINIPNMKSLKMGTAIYYTFFHAPFCVVKLRMVKQNRQGLVKYFMKRTVR